MVSYRNLFLVKALTAWNALTGGLKQFVEGVRSGWTSMRRWFHPDAGSWFLYPGSLFPISFRDWYGQEPGPWKYHPATNTLTYQCGNENVYRLGWLSAQTVVASRQTVVASRQTKDMDAFLGGLRIRTVENFPPPLTVLLQAWSIYDKRWWLIEQGVTLEWIDSDAEEHAAVPQDNVVLPLVPIEIRKEAVKKGGAPKEKLTTGI